MRRTLAFFAALFAAGLLLPQQHSVVERAEAAATVLCQAEPVSGAPPVRQVTNPNSGNTYTLNGQGCAVIGQADVVYFQTQGFTPGPPFGGNILQTTGVWSGTTSIQLGLLPPATYINHIIASNSTANAVTGGIAIGTTSGGNDVVTALACAANCLTFVNDSALLKRLFSTTASQPLWATPVTAGNNANVTLTVVWGWF